MHKEPNEKSPFIFLYENASGAVTFQLIIACLLAFAFWFHDLPLIQCIFWILLIVLLNVVRIFLLIEFHQQKLYQSRPKLTIITFGFIMFLMGCTWVGAYLILLPNAPGMREGLVILTLGGMSVGAIPSLASYLSVYLCYILPMLLPVIITNYLRLTLDYSIFSTMVLGFTAMLIVTAIRYRKLTKKTVKLDEKQRHLVAQLSISNQKLKSAYFEIKKVSRTDPLTGLPNRRFFDETLSREWNRATREKNELSILLIDVDNFKVLNDSLGHPEGDEYLKAISKVMLSIIKRPTDFLARIGGDEFAIILSNTSLANSFSVAENLRKVLCEYNEKHYPDRNLSISIGVSSNFIQTRLQSLITEADRCLYLAKAGGKNQVVSSPPS